jgi:hypothetical protein
MHSDPKYLYTIARFTHDIHLTHPHTFGQFLSNIKADGVAHRPARRLNGSLHPGRPIYHAIPRHLWNSVWQSAATTQTSVVEWVAGTWARIKQPGIYYGDMCLIIASPTSLAQKIVQVLHVPRLPASPITPAGNRKKAPSLLSLFDSSSPVLPQRPLEPGDISRWAEYLDLKPDSDGNLGRTTASRFRITAAGLIIHPLHPKKLTRELDGLPMALTALEMIWFKPDIQLLETPARGKQLLTVEKISVLKQPPTEFHAGDRVGQVRPRIAPTALWDPNGAHRYIDVPLSEEDKEANDLFPCIGTLTGHFAKGAWDVEQADSEIISLHFTELARWYPIGEYVSSQEDGRTGIIVSINSSGLATLVEKMVPKSHRLESIRKLRFNRFAVSSTRAKGIEELQDELGELPMAPDESGPNLVRHFLSGPLGSG